MGKTLVRIGFAVLTTLLALLMLWQFRTIVTYVLLSLMLAATIRPFFRRLSGQRWIKRLVWILVYIIAVGILGTILFFVLKTASTELQSLARSMSLQDEWVLPIWSGSAFQQTVLAWLPSPSALFQAIIGSEGELVLPMLLGVVQGIGGIIAAIAIIVVLSVYWGINQIHFERLWLSLLPSDQRSTARSIWRAIEPETGGYIRGQLMQSFLVGVLLGLGYWLLGSPYPVLLALFAALVCLIPVVGAVLAIIPPLLVGLLTSVQLSLLSAGYTLMILIAVLIWIKPRVFRRRWDNPILTVVLLIALADAMGIIGIIVAPPLSVVIQILWSRLVSHRVAAGAAIQVSDLKERLNRLRETVSTMEGPHLPLVTSSMERITDLIAEAEPIIEASQPLDASLP